MPHRVVERTFRVEIGSLVILGDKTPVQMTRSNPQHEDNRRVARLRKLKPLVHYVHDGGQIGPGIEEPNLRFHRECMSALLNDARPLAVVLAGNDERASQYTRRREI